MTSIELWNRDTKALISPEGAWLTNLSNQDGDILFPKRQLEAADGSAKTRGGSHVCLPNFGPGGESGLAQHGFGRTALWEVQHQTGESVELLLHGGAEGYEQLSSRLSYELEMRALKMSLELRNQGSEALRVAPAFHPYFALQAGEGEVEIDQEAVGLESLHEMQLGEGQTKELRTAKRLVRVGSTGLSTWAFWTDQLGNYVCVEPTAGGYAFLNAQPASDELLQPGQMRQYSCLISW